MASNWDNHTISAPDITKHDIREHVKICDKCDFKVSNSPLIPVRDYLIKFLENHR